VVQKKSGLMPAPGKGSARLVRLLLPSPLGWMLFVYAAVALACCWIYSLMRIGSDREQTLGVERVRLKSVNAALAAGTLAMIDDGVGSAVAAANDIAAGGRVDGASDAVVTNALLQVLTGGPYVRSVFLARPDYYARAGLSGRVEVTRAPPAWAAALPQSVEARTWVGKAITAPDRPGHTVVPIARRAFLKNGESVWAGALFDFHEFDIMHLRVAGDAARMGLLSVDGTMLVLAAPSPNGHTPRLSPSIGSSVAQSDLFKQASRIGTSGSVEGFSPAFGEDMLFAFDYVHGYPMIVVTREPMETILAPWRDRRVTTLIFAGGSSVLVVFMTALLYYYVLALRRREIHYRSLFNNATFSVMLLEGHRFVDVNDTAVRMFGLTREKQAIGLTPWELSPARQSDGIESEKAAVQRIREALETGATSFEWTHMRLDDNRTFPAQVDLSSLYTDGRTLALAVVHDLTPRKKAEQELKASEGRYRALVDAMPEAVFVHRGGKVLFANRAALELVGARSLTELNSQSIWWFPAEADLETVRERTRIVIEEGATVEPHETRIRKLDGTMLWVESQGVRVEFEGAPAAQVVMHDVTARRLRQEADAARGGRMQRQSEALVRLASRNDATWTELRARLRLICETSVDVLAAERVCIWLLDDDLRTLRCAADCGSRPGRPREGATIATSRLSSYLAALRSERVLEATDAPSDVRLSELLQAGLAWPGARSSIAAAVRSSGELSGFVLFESCEQPRVWAPDEVSFAGGVADQVTQALLDSQREQVLKDLRSLAAELMRIQDEERRRIGRDLHDSTGQTLAALEMDLTRLMLNARSLAPKEQDLLAECVRLAGLCSAEIRTASYLLHPPLLDELGLVSALRWLADGLRQRGVIEMRLELPESIPRLRPEEELTLFRVAQEALTNAHRHSASPWIAMRLKAEPDTVQLEIEDAGRGLGAEDDPSAEDAGSAAGRVLDDGDAQAGAPRTTDGGMRLGVGLAGMRERIRQVGGTFVVESTGSGTRIRAVLPLHWREERDAQDARSA
jgi:PAS domain S-box-containing protein